MMRVAVVFASIVAVLVAGPSSSARAEGLDEVKALVVKAQADYQAHRLQEAIAGAEQALSLLTEHEDQASPNDPVIPVFGAYAWRLLALAKEELGDVVGAIAAYDAYLGRYPQEDPALRAEAQKSLEVQRRMGFVEVRASVPDAELRVDGTIPRRDPSGRLVVTAGEHAIRATARGEARDAMVVVRPGEVVKLALDLAAPAPEPVTWPRTVAWVATGVGVAALATGVVGVVMAHGKRQTIEDAKDPSGHIDPAVLTQRQALALEDDARTLDGVGVAGFVVGGVAAATAIAFFLWPTGPESTSGASLSVTPEIGGASIRAAVTF